MIRIEPKLFSPLHLLNPLTFQYGVSDADPASTYDLGE